MPTPRQTRRGDHARTAIFRTGDLGVLSADGAITITGRKKDLIIRGGENISAKEIEDVLHLHPAVREASVVAMPHQRLGEGICAYIIARSDAVPTAAELAEHVARAGLAKQKNPRALRIRRGFPAHRPLARCARTCCARKSRLPSKC